MPPRSLFDNSHRPDKLVMPACGECNRGTSKSDLVASLVSRWNYLNSEKEREDHGRLAAYAKKQYPDLLAEWKGQLDRSKARNHLINQGVPVPVDAELITVGPATITQLNIFSHKTALGLYFEKFKEPMPDAGRVSAYWRTKEDFAKDGMPNELLDMMRQYGTLEQGKWNARETFEYRFETNESDGLLMYLARLRGNLFVSGFAIRDSHLIEDDDGSWIKPSDLLSMDGDPRFEKRH